MNLLLKEMLRCSKCKVTKEVGNFTKNRASKTGYSNWCKKCRADNEKDGKAVWYQKNKEKANLRLYNWRKDNIEYFREYKRKWNKDNFDYKNPQVRSNRAKSRAAVYNATPAWGDYSKIKTIYELSQIMCDQYNEKFEVDHIEPIQGEDSKGLHVWWNLCILPQQLNRHFGNKKKNINLPRVSDNFEEYLVELIMYADLHRNTKV
jgi:hypothetical protein